MQDQPLHQCDAPQRHEHLHHVHGFAQPLHVMDAIVDDAEHHDQERHQKQNIERALQVPLAVAAPESQTVEHHTEDHINRGQ
jgi:hypothetical protein